jgi:hypothetical protein
MKLARWAVPVSFGAVHTLNTVALHYALVLPIFLNTFGSGDSDRRLPHRHGHSHDTLSTHSSRSLSTSNR